MGDMMVIKGRLMVASDSPLAHEPNDEKPDPAYDAVKFELFQLDDGSFHLLETRGVPPNRVATLYRYGPYPQNGEPLSPQPNAASKIT